MRYVVLFSFYCVNSVVFARATEEPGMINHNELIKVIGGLLLVLLLIALLSWIVKRLHLVTLSTSKALQSLASMTLGPKEKVILLRAGERYLLLGVGGGVVNLLHDFGNQMPEGFDVDSKSGFATILKKT